VSRNKVLVMIYYFVWVSDQVKPEQEP